MSERSDVEDRVKRVVARVHRCLARKDFPPSMSVFAHEVPPSSRSAFRDFLSGILEMGYVPADIETYLKGPRGRFLLSFDDSFASWIELLPLLGDLGIPAVFYLNTLPFRDRASKEDLALFRARIRDTGNSPSLASEDVVELEAAGHTIGCHGHGHLSLGEVPFQEAIADLSLCRSTLSDILGHDVVHMSYPYGRRRHFSRALFDWCRRSGFRSVAHGTPGLLYGNRTPGEVQRTYWRPDDSPEDSIRGLRVDGRLYAGLTGRSPLP